MLYDGWTMEKERRTRGNRIGVTSARLHSSKRKIDLMRGARPARFTRSGKISRLRLPNCDTYYAFVIFFFLLFFVLLFSNSAFRFLLFSLDVHVSRHIWWFSLWRGGGSFDQKTGVASNKNGKKTIIRFQFFWIVSFFFISPHFFLFFFFISNSVTSIVSFPLRTSTSICQTVIAITARMICGANCCLKIIFLLVHDNVSLIKYRGVY